MRLDYDFVRFVLLDLEENLTVQINSPDGFDAQYIELAFISLSQLQRTKRCESIPLQDLYYTAKKLVEGGYIELLTEPTPTPDGFMVQDITYKGHMLLKDIHDDTVWNKTKSVVSKVGSASLSIMETVASNVIMKMLGLTP